MPTPDPLPGLDGVTAQLQRYLAQARAALVAALDGLDEYDVRRPLTPTGTNLLGLVKHATGGEWEYLGTCVGRTPPVRLPYTDAEAFENLDMVALATESRGQILDLYATVTAHSDKTLAVLPLDAPAHVRWWPEGRRDTTLGELLVRVLEDTSRHAGHADILREWLLPDSARDPGLGNATWWDDWVARLEQTAREAEGSASDVAPARPQKTSDGV